MAIRFQIDEVLKQAGLHHVALLHRRMQQCSGIESEKLVLKNVAGKERYSGIASEVASQKRHRRRRRKSLNPFAPWDGVAQQQVNMRNSL